MEGASVVIALRRKEKKKFDWSRFERDPWEMKKEKILNWILNMKSNVRFGENCDMMLEVGWHLFYCSTISQNSFENFALAFPEIGRYIRSISDARILEIKNNLELLAGGINPITDRIRHLGGYLYSQKMGYGKFINAAQISDREIELQTLKEIWNGLRKEFREDYELLSCHYKNYENQKEKVKVVTMTMTDSMSRARSISFREVRDDAYMDYW